MFVDDYVLDSVAAYEGPSWLEYKVCSILSVIAHHPSNFRLCIQTTVFNTMVSLLLVMTSILTLTGYSWTVQS